MQESIFEIIYKVIQSKYLVDAVFVGTRLQRAGVAISKDNFTKSCRNLYIFTR
jgi:hypothetical protein